MTSQTYQGSIMSLSKPLSLVLAVTMTLLMTTSALAHDPKLHSQKDQMSCKKIQKHMQMMQKMDHSKMDSNDLAMKAMIINMSKMQQSYQRHCVSSNANSRTKQS